MLTKMRVTGHQCCKTMDLVFYVAEKAQQRPQLCTPHAAQWIKWKRSLPPEAPFFIFLSSAQVRSGKTRQFPKHVELIVVTFANGFSQVVQFPSQHNSFEVVNNFTENCDVCQIRLQALLLCCHLQRSVWLMKTVQLYCRTGETLHCANVYLSHRFPYLVAWSSTQVTHKYSSHHAPPLKRCIWGGEWVLHKDGFEWGTF